MGLNNILASKAALMVHNIHMQPVGPNLDWSAIQYKQLTALLNKIYINK